MEKICALCDNTSMKTIKTIAGQTYVITSPNSCTVTDNMGVTLATVAAGVQQAVVATGSELTVSDDAALITAVFKGAPALGSGSGGGSSYTLTGQAVADVTPLAWGESVDSSAAATAPLALTYGSSFTDTSGTYTSANEGAGSITIGAGAHTLKSTDDSGALVMPNNSVTIGCKAANLSVDSVVIGAQAEASGGAQNQTIDSVAIGAGAAASRQCFAVGTRAKARAMHSAMAIGNYAECLSYASVVVGNSARNTASGCTVFGNGARTTNKSAVAVGGSASSNGTFSVSIGTNAKAADYGVVVHRSTAEDGTVTQLYFSGANTPLATTYEGGAPMLGYTVTDSAGNVTAAGTRSLLDLLTNNSTFAPATTDENGDLVMPTVFHPSDLDLPIEELTEPNEEEYTPLPVYPIVEPEIEELTE